MNTQILKFCSFLGECLQSMRSKKIWREKNNSCKICRTKNRETQTKRIEHILMNQNQPKNSQQATGLENPSKKRKFQELSQIPAPEQEKPQNSSSQPAETNVQQQLSFLAQFFGIDCLNHGNSEISNIIYKRIGKYLKPSIEIEAKFGLFTYANDPQLNRISIPGVSSECCIQPPELGAKFTPSLLPHTFKAIESSILSNSKKFPHKVLIFDKESSKLCEKPFVFVEKIKEIDCFVKNPRGGNQIRVSLDTKTGIPLRIIKKENKENINFHCPNFVLDFRVSISDEVPQDKEDDIGNKIKKPEDLGFVTMKREKERTRFHFGNILEMDFTQVTTTNAGNVGPGTTTFELEIEMNSETLINERQKSVIGLKELTDSLLSVVHVMIQWANIQPPIQQQQIQKQNQQIQKQKQFAPKK